MSDRRTAAPDDRRWPKCPKCRSADTTGRGTAPGPVDAICTSCGYEWPTCGAFSANGTTRCGLRPLKPSHRCKIHGGAAAQATASRLVHGRRSKYLPIRLAERAEEALADAELVSVREDIALAEALLLEQVEGLEDVRSAERWREAREAFERYTRDENPAALAELGRILDNGLGQQQRIDLIVRLSDHKRRLSETEIKRQAALNQTVTAMELNAFMAAVVTILKEVIPDDGARELAVRRLVSLCH